MASILIILKHLEEVLHVADAASTLHHPNCSVVLLQMRRTRQVTDGDFFDTICVSTQPLLSLRRPGAIFNDLFVVGIDVEIRLGLVVHIQSSLRLIPRLGVPRVLVGHRLSCHLVQMLRRLLIAAFHQALALPDANLVDFL